ncbi:MAG: hypothetical protein M3O82_03660 [Verrucomicrobiota bacterium]|nr:hypothetical protein [Verrucomicrobiota bacterium]
MRKSGGFTLLEICLAVLMALLIFTISVPSVRGLLADSRLHKSFETFDGLAQDARLRSIRDRRPYLLVWDDKSIELRPAEPTTADEKLDFPVIEPDKGESYDIELTGALAEKPAKEWIFWPTGTCEPATITYQSVMGHWLAKYDPLTVQGELESNAK